VRRPGDRPCELWWLRRSVCGGLGLSGRGVCVPVRFPDVCARRVPGHSDGPRQLRFVRTRVCGGSQLLRRSVRMQRTAHGLWHSLRQPADGQRELRRVRGSVSVRAELYAWHVLPDRADQLRGHLRRFGDRPCELRWLRHHVCSGIGLSARGVRLSDGPEDVFGWHVHVGSDGSCELWILRVRLPRGNGLLRRSVRMQRAANGLWHSLCQPADRQRQLRRMRPGLFWASNVSGRHLRVS